MIGVIHVDSNPFLGNQLVSKLNEESDIFVAKSFTKGKKLVDFLSKEESKIPDLLILEIGLLDISGWEICDWLISNNKHIPIIFYTHFADVDFAELAIKKNVKAFLDKFVSKQALIDAVRSVASGKHYINHLFSESLVQLHLLQYKQKSYTNPKSLTPSQYKTAVLVCQGKTRQQIAAILNVSESTIKSNINEVKSKLKLKNTNTLIAFGIASGWRKRVIS